jgi:hypothetical protein
MTMTNICLPPSGGFMRQWRRSVRSATGVVWDLGTVLLYARLSLPTHLRRKFALACNLNRAATQPTSFSVHLSVSVCALFSTPFVL